MVAWIAIACLLALSLWLTLRVRRLQGKLDHLDQHRDRFQAFMEQKAAELQSQMDADFATMKRNVEAKVKEATDGVLKDYHEVQRVAGLGAAKVREAVDLMLKTQLTDFKVLLDNAYLEQYEKMRRSPPRPKKGPRKKVDPPSQYRSLDDE